MGSPVVYGGRPIGMNECDQSRRLFRLSYQLSLAWHADRIWDCKASSTARSASVWIPDQLPAGRRLRRERTSGSNATTNLSVSEWKILKRAAPGTVRPI